LIDFHCHILAGIDDGPADAAGSAAIARILARAGFTQLHCTPHLLKGVYDNNPAEIRSRVQLLRRLLSENSVPLQLLPGAEYCFDEYLPNLLVDPLPLAGANILVEAPLHTTFAVINELAGMILAKGFTPLIAHPERTPLFSATGSDDNGKQGLLSALSGLFSRAEPPVPPGLNHALAALAGKGCRFQGNLGSFAGIYGEKIRGKALAFLDLGLYSCLGSDAHSPDGLEETLSKGIEVVQNRVGMETAARLLQGELLQ
jgi:protein-tyrosine phosphatase